MESESINEQVEWESRRVAAALGMKEWDISLFDANICGEPCQGWQIAGIGYEQRLITVFLYNPDLLFLGCVSIGPKEVKLSDQRRGFYVYPSCWAHFESGEREWHYSSRYPGEELMARGLYCLGIEDESLVLQLNSPLSAHEKLELRLSMPREFWPQKWLDEEKSL